MTEDEMAGWHHPLGGYELEDEMAGWHYPLGGYEFEQALGVGDAQGNLACCSSWGHKELDATE